MSSNRGHRPRTQFEVSVDPRPANLDFTAGVNIALRRTLTQATFADQTGINASIISNIKKGVNNITIEQVDKAIKWATECNDPSLDLFERAKSKIGVSVEKPPVAELWTNAIGVKDLAVIDSGFDTNRNPSYWQQMQQRYVNDFVTTIHKDRDWLGVKHELIMGSQHILLEYGSDMEPPSPLEILSNNDVLLIGGPATNFYVRYFLNLIPEYPLVMWMTQPEPSRKFIYDREHDVIFTTATELSTNRRVGVAAKEGAKVSKDYGIITIGENPYNSNYKLVAAMGLKGATTIKLLRFLMDPSKASKTLSLVREVGTSATHTGLQLLVEVDYNEGKENLTTYRVPRIQNWPSLLKCTGQNDIKSI